MDIKNKKVLVLGGWGLVGTAVCRKLINEKPKQIILTSLLKKESLDAIKSLKNEFPKLPKNFFIPFWGNIFNRYKFKDLTKEEIISENNNREVYIGDILDEMTPEILKSSTIYKLLQIHKPDIIIDCVNSATAIAYQDIFQTARSVRSAIKNKSFDELRKTTEQLLSTLYIPQVIRHVQLFYKSMADFKIKVYIKIGTSGTGGMGLNIPYTHSEERPSRVLLSKSAVAGAHTLLLFLMARTPDAPITKEIKPTGAIAWKKISFGEIKKKGKPIPLFDNTISNSFQLKNNLTLQNNSIKLEKLKTNLKSVFIDTGENGIFSRGEFEAISTPGQMEFVTPEEIAESVIFEIKGGNTGRDIINALDNATLEPTYRAGFMFNKALQKMKQLEKENHTESVAFEMLGPPRLSKLLYEAYLLKRSFKDINSVIAENAKNISHKLFLDIKKNKLLRSQIISIGIPILLPDGKKLIRSKIIKIPTFKGENELQISNSKINKWAESGWIDLRISNMNKWINRFKDLKQKALQFDANETSSRYFYDREYWNNFKSIEPGKLVGWIFSYEEHGQRMK
ncbi:MAG: short-chain dehydrogenase [Bacteroidetes bacterium]|nr:short-chain dehydrogenase [Bacteroidota bacterium]